MLILQDRNLKASFDASSGALVGLECGTPPWCVHGRPELGVSFRMHVPLPERRHNFVLGRRQRPASVRQDGDSVRICWDGLAADGGGLDIGVEASARLDGGGLVFDASVDNRSAAVVESFEYPWLGELAPPAPGVAMRRGHMWYSQLEWHELRPRFGGLYGYWGVLSPREAAGSDQSLFCLVQAPGQGLYVGMHDASLRYLVQYVFEQLPGPLESLHHRAPAGPDIRGTPARLGLRTVHFLFAAPGSRVTTAPIVLRPYQGDWDAGVDVYKSWRDGWFRPAPVPGWAAEVHAWQQIQLNDPEDRLGLRYQDLPAIGAECAREGVAAIQLVGWNGGGQDRDNPSHDVDPRLGSAADLRRAVEKVQAMGVRVVLFGKLAWADKTTGRYRDELRRHAVTDPYGEPYENPGYGYSTPTSLAGINCRRFAVMCPASPAWRERAVRELEKICSLGPAGVLFDEVCHHGPARYCFSPDHGHEVPAYVYAGDLPLGEALARAAPHGSGFLIAGEAPEDVLASYYPFSYFRIHPGSEPVARYLDPYAPLLVTAAGFDDRETLNRALMYRYLISYEPYNFKGRLRDFPLTLEYGKKVDALRRRYSKWLWDGEYRHHRGATVTAGGAGGQPHDLWGVFRAADGSRAVVILNEDPDRELAAAVEMPGTGPLSAGPGRRPPQNPPRGAGPLWAVTPEDPDGEACAATVTVPARSAAVLLEAAGLVEAARDDGDHVRPRSAG